ncbi:gluconate 2-dehydrogenase subunit 3 family protein [Hufsiella ginkgonis]|uniref:Gluconate 2-dehydrogenase subunit 3 family protein n=1 Tax=Hufsiella ginkgonis TaxID=2695274 RepID=A0A7K1XX42_9SPHI|nr:gluconate 2-dehydrogenase subunit 3 family protein [Hufsiella ginkgonis]MXV15086.1 gluconate 2-dehydrogenase subunit 3 family protein [Hufsiella ginkgonis]
MDRRAAVKNMALLMGSAISATTLGFILDGCNNGPKATSTTFTPGQENMVAEIAEIIIPKTSTPGAKEAGVGAFIVMMINECYPEEAQQDFIGGLDYADKITKGKFSKTFLEADGKQRIAVIQQLAEETKEFTDKEKDLKPEEQSKKVPFFKQVKELTMLGYFTSEAGATKALNYVAIPGRYDACITIKPGEKAWAL